MTNEVMIINESLHTLEIFVKGKHHNECAICDRKTRICHGVISILDRKKESDKMPSVTTAISFTSVLKLISENIMEEIWTRGKLLGQTLQQRKVTFKRFFVTPSRAGNFGSKENVTR